jgi:hypothetical protein
LACTDREQTAILGQRYRQGFAVVVAQDDVIQ